MFFRINTEISSFNLQARIKSLNFYYLISIIFIPFYIIRNYLRYDAHEFDSILFLLFFLLLVGPIISRRIHHYSFLAVWTLMTSISILLVLIFQAGGLEAPGIIWISAIPIMFGFLLGSRGSIVGSVFLFLVLAILYYFQEHGIRGSIQFSVLEFRSEKNTNTFMFSIFIFIVVNFFLKSEEKANLDLSSQKFEVETLLRILIHDIATPLSVSRLGLHQMAKLNQIDVKTQRIMDKVNLSIDTIDRILKEIRTLRAVRDGKTEIKMKPINLKENVSQGLEILGFIADKKGVKIDFIFEKEDTLILADEIVFKVIVFSNLITNAIKFSNSGEPIRISIKEDGSKVKLCIRDFGIGIPKDLLPNIWNVQKRTSRTGSHGELGTGYGMPLVKEFVTKLGARIFLETSEVDLPDFKRGTEITIEFSIYR